MDFAWNGRAAGTEKLLSSVREFAIASKNRFNTFGSLSWRRLTVKSVSQCGTCGRGVGARKMKRSAGM